MENINRILNGLRYKIRISILEIMVYDLDLRESIPNDNKDGFCPEDILNILNSREDYNLTYSKLSYHLKEMRESNIIQFEPEGKRRFYKINYESINALECWLKKIQESNRP